MQPDFNWNDLKFFVAMVRAGNPNAASKLLKVDHNTVRRRIAALEQDLGAQLFDRRNDSVTLTDAGEKLLRFAEIIENAATGAEAEIAGRDAALSGSIRIGVPDGLGTVLIAPLMVEFRNLYPSLSIELVLNSHDFNLSKREADMAIIIDRPKRGNMIIKKLTNCHMRLYAARSYLDRFPPIETPADLANHIFVSGIEGLDFGAAVNKFIDEGALAPNLTCSSSIAQLKAAAAGGGLCTFAEFLARTEPLLVPVLEDQVSLDLEIWLAYHADLKELRRIKILAAFLADAFQREHRYFT